MNEHEFQVGDIVALTINLGKVIGKTTDGRIVVEWTYDEIDAITVEQLFLIEEKKEDDAIEMPMP
jgi:YD repeat-containing protein